MVKCLWLQHNPICSQVIVFIDTQSKDMYLKTWIFLDLGTSAIKGILHKKW